MGEPCKKTPGTPASSTWLVSHVASAGFEPAPDTVVREYKFGTIRRIIGPPVVRD